jgi:hypothetical protein
VTVGLAFTFTTIFTEGLVHPLADWVTVYVLLPSVVVLGVGPEGLAATVNCRLLMMLLVFEEVPSPCLKLLIVTSPEGSVIGYEGELNPNCADVVLLVS